MSFLLGAIPIIGEVALEIGTAIGEYVGSETVGKIATGAVVGAVGNIADKGVNAVLEKTGINDTVEQAKLIMKIRSGNFTNEEIIKMMRTRSHNENAKDISKFVKEVSTKSVGDSVPNILEKIKLTNPVYYLLASKMMDLTHDFVLPNDEEYQKVSSVYDGSVFFKNDVVKKEDGNFHGITEKGELVWKYPEYNNYTVIPSLWGYWVGISSINNEVPIYANYEDLVVQSQLDKIAFAHDVLYHDNGLFNKFADYVLISYIDAGIKQGIFVLPNELETAKIARTYFSTLGILVRKIYGDDVSKGLIEGLLPDTDKLKEVFIEEFKKTDYISSEAVGVSDNVTSPAEQELLELINNLTFELD